MSKFATSQIFWWAWAYPCHGAVSSCVHFGRAWPTGCSNKASKQLKNWKWRISTMNPQEDESNLCHKIFVKCTSSHFHECIIKNECIQWTFDLGKPSEKLSPSTRRSAQCLLITAWRATPPGPQQGRYWGKPYTKLTKPMGHVWFGALPQKCGRMLCS